MFGLPIRRSRRLARSERRTTPLAKNSRSVLSSFALRSFSLHSLLLGRENILCIFAAIFGLHFGHQLCSLHFFMGVLYHVMPTQVYRCDIHREFEMALPVGNVRGSPLPPTLSVAQPRAPGRSRKMDFLWGYLTGLGVAGLSGLYLFFVLGPWVFRCKKYHGEEAIGTDH